MKKTFALLLALCLVLGLAACGAPATASTTAPATAPAAETSAPADAGDTPAINYKHLGVVVPGLANEFWVSCANACTEMAKQYGIECTVVSYDNEIARELTCIENLATAGCDAIFYCANDPVALEDVSQRYKNEGITMIPYAGIFDNKDCYSVSIPVGQREMAIACANMASEWVDKTFPDAGEGEVGVIILGGRNAAEFTNKTDGFW